MLDDKSGFDLIERIRAHSKTTPVIFMSARDKEFDRIIGLEKVVMITLQTILSEGIGFTVNNIIRRVYNQDVQVEVDGYIIDEKQRKAIKDDMQLELTTKEFDLLMMFVKNRGVAFTREQILVQVWETNYFGSDRVVDDTLRRLRKKMPGLNIQTIYGYGYRLG